jgi:hypothetical protein
MNFNISDNAIGVITFDMKHPKMLLLKWNVIVDDRAILDLNPSSQTIWKLGRMERH